MKNKANIVEKVKYIHGNQNLRPEDICFDYDNITDDGLIEFGMQPNFDVDAVFGTHVNTQENDDTLSAYAYLNVQEEGILDYVKVIIWDDEGGNEYRYHLNPEEKIAVLSAMKKYCSKIQNVDAVWIQKVLNAANSPKEKEFQYIVQFAMGACFDQELCCDQMRALWTAYCFHHNLTVDTQAYDYDAQRLWQAVRETEEDTTFWGDFESFDSFLCKYLV